MVCKNRNYQKVCGALYKYAPCCNEIGKKYPSLPSSNISGEVCIAEIFELAKIATDNKLIKFRSRGTCMYPILKPKDILYIEPKTAEEIKVGDIAVFRRFNYLYGHRTIETGRCGDAPYILTRSDTSRCADGGPAFNEDILGVISAVERNGRVINIAKEEQLLARREFFRFHIKWNAFKKELFNKIIDFIQYLQQMKLYKKIAMYWRVKFNNKILISIRVPLNFKMTSRFYQVVSVDEFKMSGQDITGQNEFVPRWSIIANVDKHPAGLISFIYKPKSCPFSGWWISELNIRIRYRSLGIEEELFKEIEKIFKQAGIREILVSFSEKRRFNSITFKSLGFKETAAYNDSFSEFNRKGIVVPIVMQRLIA